MAGKGPERRASVPRIAWRSRFGRGPGRARLLTAWLMGLAVLAVLVREAPAVVVTPPAITKAFGAAAIPLNTSTSLTFTITNPNGATDLTGVSFSDTLPAGLI